MFQLTYKDSKNNCGCDDDLRFHDYKIIITFVLIDNNVFNEAIMSFYVGYDAGFMRVCTDAGVENPGGVLCKCPDSENRTRFQ
jgi:hypothetical protein